MLTKSCAVVVPSNNMQQHLVFCMGHRVSEHWFLFWIRSKPCSSGLLCCCNLCLCKCLSQHAYPQEDPDEEKLECMVKLMTTVGKQLEQVHYRVIISVRYKGRCREGMHVWNAERSSHTISRLCQYVHLLYPSVRFVVATARSALM